MGGWQTGDGWEGTPEQAAAAAAASGSSTLTGTYLNPNTADVTDGGGVAFTKTGNSIQAVVDTMSGSASSSPSTMQKGMFWDSGIQAQDILSMMAVLGPTATIEETSAITAPVVVMIGWVAVPSGGTPSLANLATHKSRWTAFRISGPYIQVDAGQDNGGFSWSGGLNLDVTDPTDYGWVSAVQPLLYRNLEPQVFFTNIISATSYAGTSGSQEFEQVISDGLNDDLNDDDTIFTFFAIGRTATGGSERTIAIKTDNAVVQKAGA